MKKFNWGHGLALALLLAIAGFLTLVFITTRERIDMVTEDYYPKELKYDNQIEKIKNYNALTQKVSVALNHALVISFPNNVADVEDIKGLVHLYRPSDKALDIEKEIKLDSAYQMRIGMDELKAGKYKLIIEWEANQQPYLTVQELYID